MKESSIIAACRKGDPKAQKALYEQYLPYLLAICRRFHLALADQKDVVQEIFIAAFSSIGQYDPARGEFKYWLKSIAIHKMLNYLRSEKTSRTVDLDPSLHDGDVANEALKNLNQEYLIRLIAALPAGYRTVFNLYVIDGYSHREIGQMLGIDEASSRSQLTRARKLLQDQLRKQQNSSYHEPG